MSAEAPKVWNTGPAINTLRASVRHAGATSGDPADDSGSALGGPTRLGNTTQEGGWPSHPPAATATGRSRVPLQPTLRGAAPPPLGWSVCRAATAADRHAGLAGPAPMLRPGDQTPPPLFWVVLPGQGAAPRPG